MFVDHGLMPILTITRLNPGQKLITEEVTGTVGQFGTGTFHVDIVACYVVIGILQVFRKCFVKCISDSGRLIIDWEMPDNVVFCTIKKVHASEVQREWMVEVFYICADCHRNGPAGP